MLYEYIWLDYDNNFRSKVKITDGGPTIWNYDGSSTGQATTKNSEISIIPVFTCNNPFINNSMLVWCQAKDISGNYLSNSTRHKLENIINDTFTSEPWFGFEQEYFMLYNDKPEYFEKYKKQGIFYCGNGSNLQVERKIAEKHLQNCLKAGIKICGMNAEVAVGQWEYQIGIVNGYEAGDHLWMSRFILVRTAEEFGYDISFHPKPLGVDSIWNGSGLHTNFSTKETREPNGMNTINEMIGKLSINHNKHMEVYGKDNELRMTGKCETSSYSQFTYGLGNRGASIRIPNQTLDNNCGYIEDRRPASNADPYDIVRVILETINTTKCNIYGIHDINYVI